MKSSLLLLLVSVAFPACGSLRIGPTPARRIAKDAHLPGKGVDGQCLPYARSLHRRLQTAGIPSKVIVFRYESMGRMPSPFSNNASYGLARPQSGAHAIVAYNDGGRMYVTDNQSWMPQWVRGDSAEELARQVGGMDHHITAARELGSRTASTQNTRKSRALAMRSKRATSGSPAIAAKGARGASKSRVSAAKIKRSTDKSRIATARKIEKPSKSRATVAKSKPTSPKRHVAMRNSRATKSPNKAKPSPSRGIVFRGRPIALR